MNPPLQPDDSNSPVPQADTKGMCSFEELRREGYTPFSLGPVYVYAGVQWDLVAKFYEEVGSEPVREANYDVAKGKLDVSMHKLDVRGVHVRFERPIISHCPGWSHVINVLDSDSFTHFKKWVLTQQFVNRAERKFYLIRHYSAPLLDPLILDTFGKASPEMMDLFSICGMKGSLVPKDRMFGQPKAKTFIEMQHAPPEEAVILIGAAALKVVRDS